MQQACLKGSTYEIILSRLPLGPVEDAMTAVGSSTCFIGVRGASRRLMESHLPTRRSSARRDHHVFLSPPKAHEPCTWPQADFLHLSPAR